MVDLSRLVQDAAILEVIDKSADEASNLSAQNSYQAIRIEELEAKLAECMAHADSMLKSACHSTYDYAGAFPTYRTWRAKQ